MSSSAPSLTIRALKEHGPHSSLPLYAVVSKVSAGQLTATSAKLKTLVLVDESCPSGVTVSCVHNVFAQKEKRNIIPGNILRISRVARQADGTFSCDEAVISQIPAFRFDYENGTPASFAATYFPKGDSQIVRRLEKWFADRILLQDFSQLPVITPGSKTYIDFVCQVLEQRATKRNVNLTVWDGSQPSFCVTDNFRAQYCDYIYGDTFCRKNDDVFHLAPQKHVYITIWKNESQSAIDHYHTCSTLELSGTGGMLLFLNAEIMSTAAGVALNLRSGHHQGKAVRVVHPDSVLGRQLNRRLTDAIFDAEMEACGQSDDPVFSEAPVVPQTGKRKLTSAESELLHSLPAHMSLSQLMSQSDQSLDSFKQLVLHSDDMNFPADDLSNGFGKEQVLQLLHLLDLIRSDVIEFDVNEWTSKETARS